MTMFLRKWLKIIAYIPLLVVVVTFMSFALSSPGENVEFRNVLFLNSYGASHSSFSDKHQGLKEIFDDSGVQFDMEFLDSKRLKTDENYHRFYNLLLYRINNTEPYDAIVVSDDDALLFVLEHQETLFRETPIVFLGINNIELALEAGKNPWITGVVEAISLKETVAIAHTLNPSATTVLAVVDQTVTGQANLAMYYDAKDHFPNLNFTELNLGLFSLDDFLNELKALQQDTIVIYLAAFQDKDSKNLGYLESTTLISSVAPVPVYQISDIGIGSGITGGYVINFVSQGNEAAKMVLENFSGKPVHLIEVMSESPNVYKFDYLMMEKHNLDKNLLPPNTLLINYDRSLFEDYLGLILTISFVIALQVLIITLLIINIRKRHLVEQNLLLKNEEITDLNRELLLTKEDLEDLNFDLEARVVQRSSALEEAVQELYKKERMASLGSLVAGISHEVNTPLGVAVTTISYLNDQNKHHIESFENNTLTPDELRNYLSTVEETGDIIDRNLSRAADLIKSFKEIAVSQSSEIETLFNLKEHIDSVILALKHEYKNTNHTIKNCIDEDLLIKSCPGAYSQITTNFLMNSLIHGFADKKNGQIKLSAAIEDEILVFTYEDDGKGIEPEHLTRIFDPFFTTSRRMGGSGLGLSIVFNLVTDQLNGTIKCISQINEGAKFVLTVPSVTSENPQN